MFKLIRAIALPLTLLSTMASGADLADPTRPPGKSITKRTPQTYTLNLQSTLISPQRKIAVINGRSLSIGDRIHGYRIVTINPNRVMLVKGQTEKEIHVLSGNLRRPASMKGNQ